MKCKRSDCFTCPYPDCINDSVTSHYRPAKERLAKQSAKAAETAKKRAAAGLCTLCGKRKPRPGYRTCSECAARQRRAANASHYRNGTTPRILMDGVSLCKKCGKNPPTYGYAVCERCLELCRSALDKTPTHNGKSLDTGFARALRADYLLNKKENEKK